MNMVKKYNQFINEGLKDYLTGPTQDDINNYHKQEFLNGIISLYDYINKIKRLKLDTFTFNELKGFYNTELITLDDFISASYRLGYTELCRYYLDDKMEDILEDSINTAYSIIIIKHNLKLTNAYIFSKTKNFSINDKMILCAELMLISELKKCIENGADITYNNYEIFNRLRLISRWNKKATPLLNYVLNLLNFPDNCLDFLDDYFKGCKFKKINIKEKNNIVNALVKNDEVLIYSYIPNYNYMVYNSKLYNIIRDVYNISDFSINDKIKDYLVTHGLNRGLFDNYGIITTYNNFKNIDFIINEGLKDYLTGPNREEMLNTIKTNFNESGSESTFLIKLVENEFSNEIIDYINNNYDYIDDILPFVMRLTYHFNKPELRKLLLETIHLTSDNIEHIIDGFKKAIGMKPSIENILKELHILKNILKYKEESLRK